MSDAQQIKLSRVGKLPIPVPAGVTVTISGNHVHVKGPKGELERDIPMEVTFEQEGDVVNVMPRNGGRRPRAMQGLARALMANMVTGVANGFERKLNINGVGYRADLKGKSHIFFLLGYSHPIIYQLPAGVSAEIAKDNTITLRSIDKEVLGLAAAKIRSFRAPEPYKGKGVKYAEEVIVRKAGKAAAR